MGKLTGAVAIGRNEGDKLRRCLESLLRSFDQVVYVDSGSTDGSRELARKMGATVLDLDTSVPFSAARARNAGFSKLLEVAPDLELVQFVDGDCELVAGWVERAESEIQGSRDLAVVCGRRRERYRDASIYNLLCDLEWDTPVGYAKACGGDALMRISAFREVNGFDPLLIAGEEPELCLRLGRRGWKILRMDAEMTLHDAAMTRFGQWWKRAVRAGHAYAEGASMHGKGPEQHWVRETRSGWFWGLVIPSASLGLMVPSFGLSLSLLAGYPLLLARTYRGARKRGMSPADARLYAPFCVLAKVPEALGQLRFQISKWTGRKGGIIEYKDAEPNQCPGT